MKDLNKPHVKKLFGFLPQLNTIETGLRQKSGQELSVRSTLGVTKIGLRQKNGLELRAF